MCRRKLYTKVMTETLPAYTTTNLDEASIALKVWWRLNGGEHLSRHEQQPRERAMAERIIKSTFYAIGREHKLQLTAGQTAVRLFSFGKDSYDFLTIDRRFGDDYDLQPGQTMDLTRMREDLPNSLYHPHPALYLGQTLHTHSIAIAETLTEGGSIAIVPADVEQTYRKA